MREGWQVFVGRVAIYGYELISLATFVFLTGFDGYRYTAWNWLIALPVNAFVSSIWPLYWLVLRPFFGH